MTKFSGWPTSLDGMKPEVEGPQGQVACFMWITPADAQRILDEANTSNIRRLNPRRVNEYLRYMQAGEWSVGDSAISFDPAGRLRNGQHRLTSLSRSTIRGAWFVVMFGVTTADERGMDQGAARGISITHDVARRHAAAVRLLIDTGLGVGHATRFTVERVAAAYHRDVVQAVEWAGKIQGGGAVFAAAALGALLGAATPQRQAVVDVCASLADLTLTTPQLRLVKRWIDNNSPLTGASRMRAVHVTTLMRGFELASLRLPLSHLRITDEHRWLRDAMGRLDVGEECTQE